MAFGFLTARNSFLASGSDEEARRAAVARFELDPQSDLEADALAFLVLAMGDESWRVRKEAVARASAWTDRLRAARVLTGALSEPDNVGRRNAAIEALVALGYDAVGSITDVLQQKPEHRKVLVDTLGLIGDAAGSSALVPLLDDGDANVRVAAAESLGLIGGAEAQIALRGVLARGELLLTLAALDGLNKLGARLTTAELTPLVEQPTLRAAALEALGRSGDLSALPRLIAGLADGGRGVREAAIVAVNALYPRLDGAGQREVQAQLAKLSVIQPLVQALLEGTLGVQRAAARVLGLTRRADAVRPLTLALSDNELREDALAALVSIGSAGLETLVALAPDLEGRLRADVYALLPRFGPSASEPRVQSLLAEALEDEDPDAAAGAAQALGEVGTREALAPLLHALERAQGEESSAAQAAAQALGRLGTRHYEEVRILITSRGLSGPEAPHLVRVLGACGRESDAALLRGALGADSPSVRRAAAEALAQLGGTSSTMAVEIGDALLFALADEAPEVRAAAARALAGHPRNASVTAVDALERAAHDLEMAVRAAAARALGALALTDEEAVAAVRPRAAAVLRRLAESNEAVAAVPALEALGRLGEAQDESRLIAALDKEDAEIVKAGARGLGARRDTGRSREALERALTDRRWDVRRAAALALGEHGPSAHPLLYARRTVEQDALVVEALEEAMQVAMGKRPRAR